MMQIPQTGLPGAGGGGIPQTGMPGTGGGGIPQTGLPGAGMNRGRRGAATNMPMGRPSTTEVISPEERAELMEWFAREQGPW